MLTNKWQESRAYGNEHVVELLEGWLELAREGKMCHVALVGHQLPNLMAFEFAGIVDVECTVPLAFDIMRTKMWEDARLRTALPDQGKTADYVQYNLGNSPTSYDFLIWLILAEMERVREGAPYPLKVSFTRGQTGDKGLKTEYNKQVFDNVMRPLLPMVGAVETTYDGGRQHRDFTIKHIVAANQPVPKLKAPLKAQQYMDQELAGVKPIVITLREMETWAHRNSNLEAWKEFAKEQEAKGEMVIFVRDTAKANEPIKDFVTFPLASINIHIRQALYERAKCNLFVPNGPYNLALFGGSPWLCFNAVSETDPYHWNRPSTWKEHLGVAEGDQYSWSLPSQRLVWKADTIENIRDAYNAIQ